MVNEWWIVASGQWMFVPLFYPLPLCCVPCAQEWTVLDNECVGFPAPTSVPALQGGPGAALLPAPSFGRKQGEAAALVDAAGG